MPCETTHGGTRMTDTDRRRTTERRIADHALKGFEKDGRQPDMGGLTEAPTSPRENPPVDEARVARSHEDYHRILGN